MKYRKGDTGAHITQLVLRPLIERGYLTWRDAGWTDDPKQGGRYLTGDQWKRSPWSTSGQGTQRGSEHGGEITQRVVDAVRQFQQDSGIYHQEQGGQRNVEGKLIHPSDQRVSSGVVGMRTLKALGTSLDDPGVQKLIAHRMRETAAQAEITKSGGPEIVKRIAGIRDAYPQLDSRVTAALALGGHGLDDPVTKTMIGLSMQRDNKPFWSKIPHDERVPAVDELGSQINEAEFPKGALGHPETYRPKPAEQDQGGSDMGPFGTAGVLPSIGLDAVGSALGVDSLGDVIRTPLEWANQAAKPAARATFTALETPYQAVVGAGRNAAGGLLGATETAAAGRDPSKLGSYSGEPTKIGDITTAPGGASIIDQTSGGLAVQQLLQGKSPDLGSGYFPGGQIEKQQAENSRKALSVAGHAATPGRLLATVVTDPGTQPYNLLSGIADAASITTTDPANLALEKVSDIRAARKVINLGEPIVDPEATGLVAGLRRWVNPKTADEYLTSGQGAKFVTRAALAPEEKGGYSFNDLRRIFKGDAETAALVERASSPEEVRQILNPKLGISLREAPTAPYAWNRVVRNVEQNHRIWGMRPSSSVDLSDLDGAVEGFDRFWRNGKLTQEERNDLGSRLALANGREERFNVIMDGGRMIQRRMIEHGVDRDAAKTLTQFWDDYNDLRHYMVDSAGDDVNPFVDIADEARNLPHPAMFVDFLDNYVPLPDPRAIRRGTSDLSRKSKMNFWFGEERTPDRLKGLAPEAPGGATGAKVGDPGAITAAADKAMRAWKPVVLARPAWTLRVIGEEQIRMAATGNWDHPLHHIISLITQPRAQTDALGKSFVDEWEEAAKRGDYTEYARARSGGFTAFALDDGTRLRVQRGHAIYSAADDAHAAEYVRTWGERIERLHADPVGRYLAEHGPEETKDWLAHDVRGRYFWNQMVSKSRIPDRPITAVPDIGNYVDDFEAHIQDITQSDPLLRDTIASGKWNDEPIMAVKGSKLKPNRNLRTELRARRADPDRSSPNFIAGRRFEAASADDMGRWDKTVDGLFDVFMTKPTNRLSRSPMFMKSYWRRMEELLPGLSSDDLAKTVDEAEANGFKDVAKTGRGIKGVNAGQLSLKDADLLSKRFALNETKQLLYDLDEKSQFFDVMRNFLPFGEAWKEVLTRWARIMYEHPENLRRAQIGIQGLRGADPFNQGHGFFYQDPSLKQEMFVWPGSEWMTKKLTGVPIPIGGSVTGLNMLAQGMPGVGPAVQVPAGLLMPDDPDFDWLRNAIDPYGKADVGEKKTPFGLVADSLTPSWLGKFFNAAGWGPEQDRARATMAVAATMRTSGDYPDTPAGQKSLMADAKKASRAFWLIRMLGSAGAPTAPIPQYQVFDKDGHGHSLNKLKDVYYGGLDEVAPGDEGKYDKAFVAKYGLDVYSELVPLTRAVGELPRTKKQVDWARRNPGIKSDFPYVYAFFAPNDPKGEQDESAASRQIAADERQALSPDQHARLVQDRKADYLYAQNTADLADDADGQETKRTIANILRKHYPGWNDESGLIGRTESAQQIPQITAAVRDPRLRNTAAAKGIRLYLKERDAVRATARDNGIDDRVGWQQAKSMLDERRYLAQVKKILAKHFPSSARALSSVFYSDTADVEDSNG